MASNTLLSGDAITSPPLDDTSDQLLSDDTVVNQPVDAPTLAPLFTKLRHWRELYRDYWNEFLYACMACQWLPGSLFR